MLILVKRGQMLILVKRERKTYGYFDSSKGKKVTYGYYQIMNKNYPQGALLERDVYKFLSSKMDKVRDEWYGQKELVNINDALLEVGLNDGKANKLIGLGSYFFTAYYFHFFLQLSGFCFFFSEFYLLYSSAHFSIFRSISLWYQLFMWRRVNTKRLL